MPISVTFLPDRMLPIRTADGRVAYAPISDTYGVKLQGLSLEQCKALAEFLQAVEPSFSPVESINAGPGAPALPAEFRRRLELD